MFRFHNGRGAAFGGDVGGKKALTLRPVIKHSPLRAFCTNCVILGWRGLLFMLRHPVEFGVIAAYVYSLIVLGPFVTIIIDLALLAAAVVWWQVWPGSFNRYVDQPLYGWWRHLWRYARKWQSTMKLAGLVAELGDDRYVPGIRRVRSNQYVDHVQVDMVNGQFAEDFEKQTGALAATFRARAGCRVRTEPTRPDRVWLDFYRRDALEPIIPALPVPEMVEDFYALPIGLTQFGDPWKIQVQENHLFIAGVTGAGKSSVVWSIIRAMAPAIRDGSVRLWGVDPKRGMELNKGRELFYRLEASSDEDAQVELLADAVDEMGGRADSLSAAGRRLLETPTPAEPLNVVLVDEGAWRTAYDRDAPRKRNAGLLLQKLCSQGRAPGFVTIFAVQDPRKEVCDFRHMFPTCIGLRLKERRQTDMVLGEGYWDMGAECEKIRASQPGAGFLVIDGVREPVKVRAGHVTDDDLAEMCRLYAPGAAQPIPAQQRDVYANRDKTVPVAS